MAEAAKPKDVVLVVEDEALVRMNSADLIRDLGFDVIEAVDADHAVLLLESMPGITVLFTDIQMPGIDGRAPTCRGREGSMAADCPPDYLRPTTPSDG